MATIAFGDYDVIVVGAGAFYLIALFRRSLSNSI